MNFSTSLLKIAFNPNVIPLRNCKKLTKGIQYPGFIYYPRTDDFKDPPYEPKKLFYIRRLKKLLKGLTKDEKKILEELEIAGEENRFGNENVVKNIPSVNAKLWKVKHLIEIRPIYYKGELPKNGDYTGTFLRQTGELVISPKLGVTPSQLEASHHHNEDDAKFRVKYVRDYLKKKWLDGYNGSV